MLLYAGQVVRFKGSDGVDRAIEFERELCGRGERIGNEVTVKRRTHFKPNLSAEIEQFGFEEAAAGRNGRHEAMRV